MSNILEAIKVIYPNINGGYSYWETQPNGKDWLDPIDGLVWENTEYTKPTWEAIQAVLPALDLQQAKDEKIQKIKQKRTEINSSVQILSAYEILDPLNPLSSKSAEKVSFDFNLKSTGDLLTEPTTVILNLLIKSTFVTLGQMPAEELFTSYSCNIHNADGSKRKGYVFIDLSVLASIAGHIESRVVNNIQVVNDLEMNINNATTIEQVETLYNENAALNVNASRFIAPS